MTEQKDKITNLKIFYFQSEGLYKHVLEANYIDGAHRALLITDEPEKMESMVRIIKASDKNIYVTSMVGNTYKSIAEYNPNSS